MLGVIMLGFGADDIADGDAAKTLSIVKTQTRTY